MAHLVCGRQFTRCVFCLLVAALALCAVDLRAPARARTGDAPAPLRGRAAPGSFFDHLNNYKLSSSMPAWGDVDYPRYDIISPDGAYAVYVADPRTDLAFEIFSVSLHSRAAPVRLCPSLPAGRGIELVKISPDSRRVIYTANEDSDTIFDLYSVPITGGFPAKLSKSINMTGGREVDEFWISPDSRRVVFLADPVEQGRFELYSVPIEGGAAVQFPSPPLVTRGQYRHRLAFSPDSRQVIFLGEPEGPGGPELYSAPAGGAAAKKINGPLAAGGLVIDFLVSPDSSRAVYLAYQDNPQMNQIYSVMLDGGKCTRLNPPLVSGGSAGYEGHFAISSDSQRVVYIADQDVAGNHDLYSVPIDGGAAVLLSDLLDYRWDVIDFLITPDGRRVVFMLDLVNLGLREIYSIQIAGGNWVRLSTPYGSEGLALDFAISPDSRRVVYRTGSSNELFSVLATGGTALPLTVGVIPAEWTVYEYAISPDSSFVAYTAGTYGDPKAPVSLFGTPIAAAQLHRLNHAMVSGGNVNVPSIPISPNSRAIVYLADQEVDERYELYIIASEVRLYSPVMRKK